jgi:hypothetical protein
MAAEITDLTARNATRRRRRPIGRAVLKLLANIGKANEQNGGVPIRIELMLLVP